MLTNNYNQEYTVEEGFNFKKGLFKYLFFWRWFVFFYNYMFHHFFFLLKVYT